MIESKTGGYIRKTLKVAAAVIFTVLVCALLAVCFIYRKQITAEKIIQFTPQNQVAAVMFMMLIFAAKSLCVFIYCGILYAACGMVFSAPIAICVNILGTVVMTSVPYIIGKRAGGKYVEKLVEKHPKLTMLKEAQGKNSFFMSFIVRLTGILPSDIVSAYFGAVGISYGKYVFSTVLGFLPMIVTFTVMGMSAHDATSPAFIISAGLQIVIMILSGVSYMLMRKKEKNRKRR